MYCPNVKTLKIFKIPYKDSESYDKTDKMKLSKFSRHTMPRYQVTKCLFDSYDCSNSFKILATLQGNCIALDPNGLKDYNSFGRLKLTLMLNNTDLIGGWEGNNHGKKEHYTALIFSLNSPSPFRKDVT